VRLATIAFAAAILLVPQTASAQACKGRSEIVAACFTVHGRLSAYNGAPTFRIWRIGTRRILGVAGGEDPVMPPSLRAQAGFDADLFGDYEVCPFTPERPGRMQMVCIESASRLVRRDATK